MVLEAEISRIVIEDVRPQVDGGRFPIKRSVGEVVAVEADIFADGHDLLGASLLYRSEASPEQRLELPMEPLVNDRWRAVFAVTRLGRWSYTVRAWVDPFKTWRRDLKKRGEAGQDLTAYFLEGADMVEASAETAPAPEAARLREAAGILRSDIDAQAKLLFALGETLFSLMERHPLRRFERFLEKELWVTVDREKARFSTWYEMFPRSCAPAAGAHGTFRDCRERLPYIAEMGFDVLYLPPIHPIGRINRKGKNNAVTAGPEDPGSPWAIGAREGGHTAVHARLGGLKDFRDLREAAEGYGIELAIDLAFQCAPDHPYVSGNPEWFRKGVDGGIKFAENPPKKYEDIYPLDFEGPEWRPLWEELLGVVRFWIAQGIRIFRVDNPHTKPFVFWEWLIGEVKKTDPETLFLSEAFTRPKVMYRLAKLGFSQSYTYFAWRNTKDEITRYFTELTRTRVAEFFRPNLWPNTPDILTEYLQFGGRPAFMTRLVLAATLGASYGIYGPPFELCENRAREKRSEEYDGSEKYEIRNWNLEDPGSLRKLIARINRIRRENPALRSDRNLTFIPIGNDQMISYLKHTDDFSNIVLTVVNLDPHHPHSGWLEVPVLELGLDPRQPYQVHDLLGGARYLWHGSRNFVQLDPNVVPAHIFRIRRRVRTEHDFDYFL